MTNKSDGTHCLLSAAHLYDVVHAGVDSLCQVVRLARLINRSYALLFHLNENWGGLYRGVTLTSFIVKTWRERYIYIYIHIMYLSICVWKMQNECHKVQ